MNYYYKMANGDLIPKQKVDDAFDLLRKMSDGCSVIQLSDSAVFSFGDKIDAIRLYKEKNNCSLIEARAAIESMRNEDEFQS